MSDQLAEVSEVSSFVPDGAPNLGDAFPSAEETGHAAEGEPRSYGDRPEQDDPLRSGSDDPGDRKAPLNE